MATLSQIAGEFIITAINSIIYINDNFSRLLKVEQNLVMRIK